MKKSMFLAIVIAMLSMTACTNVGAKERGIKEEWGGKINTKVVYTPGMYWGFEWLTADMITYDVSEKTIVEKYAFNDRNNMETGVEISLDYSENPGQVGLLHTKITDYVVKLKKTLKSSAKEVIPQYAASELNLTKRQDAEQKLASILEKELPEFFLLFNRVQITDVDIPKPIAEAAVATARQDELNKLAAKKEQEAQNNYNAAVWDAKTKDILSQPSMLALKKLDIEMEWAKQGVSPYGNNNVFGVLPEMMMSRK